MDNRPGVPIAKALRAFTRQTLRLLAATVPNMTARDADWCVGMVASYRQTLKALMKLPEFAGNEIKADAYICGYYRGL